MSTRRSGGELTQQPGRSLLSHVAAWISAALLATAAVFWTFGWISGGSAWPWGTKHAPDLFQVVRSTVTVVALLGGTVAAAIAIRRQRSTEQSVIISAHAQRTSADATRVAARAAEVAAEAARVQAQVYELDRERHAGEQIKDLRQRFITAAQQVGNASSPAVRIAGLYALTALANDWLAVALPAEAQTCIDVLCAYLRMPPPRALVEHMLHSGPAIESELASELEVRHTAQRLIVDYGRHHDTVATAPNIDLAGAHLHNFAARDATFNGEITSFERAIFSGDNTAFHKATLNGRTASFEQATFRSRTTSFDGAIFSGEVVSFERAIFSGTYTNFDWAIFSGRCAFMDHATFSAGHTSLHGATFSGAYTSFTKATFGSNATSFTAATFSGEIVWSHEESSYIDDLPDQLRAWGASRQ